MSTRLLTLIAMAGSAALLLGAWGFQVIGGLAPCSLCVWQRYPHGAVLFLGAVSLLIPGRALPLLAGLAALTSAGIGVYHTGVERSWWQGPSTCSSADISALTPEQLMEQIMAAPLVRCDEVAWQMAGLSMASWNAVFSLMLALLWVAIARRA